MANLLSKIGNFLSYRFNDAPGSFTHAAATNNFAEVDRLLEKYGPELINKTGITRSSGLMNAVMYGHEGMADHLLARGADVNYSDHTGTTALMLAARFQRDSLYKKLVQHGANEGARDEWGRDAKAHAEISKQAAEASAAKKPAASENVMTSTAHIAHPLNIYNPWR